MSSIGFEEIKFGQMVNQIVEGDSCELLKYIPNGEILFRFAAEVIEKESVKLVNTITWIKSNPTPRQFKRRLVSSTELFFHFVKSCNYYYNLDEFLTELNTKKEKRKRENTSVGKKYFELIEESTLFNQEKQNAREELQKVIAKVKNGKIAELPLRIFINHDHTK